MDFVVWLLTYIIPFLVVLTVIVFVHEMGHYLVARWNGVAVQTFSLGFGPELVGFDDRRGTRWRLSAIPLGGYVRFLGDMNAASMPDEAAIAAADPALRPKLFVNKNVWRRIAVVVAGPAANIVFTFLVMYALLLGYGRYSVPAIIDAVTPGSVAAQAGLEPGDRILSVDGFAVRGFEDFQRLIATAPERQVTVELSRGSETETLTMVPEAAAETDRFGESHRVGRIGVSKNIARDDFELYRPNPVEAVGMTFEEVRFIIDRTVAFLGDFFVGRGDVQQLGGPVKVAEISGQVASLGVVPLINLMALLSLNIGVFNLLPIPLLDGGHLVYYLIEAVRGRPLSQRVQEIGYRFGLAIVFVLMAFTIINDLL
jgi:regulator of sigma E protease